MAHTKTKTVYFFDELDEHGKESARSWYRAGALDYEWWDCVFDDAKQIGNLMGIKIDDIYFSGFASQGDGACFTGEYAYAKGGLKAVKGYAPKDGKLHQIAADLQEAQRRAFYRLSAAVTHSGRYSHEYCTNITVYDTAGYYASAEDADGVSEALRDFMRWIYRQLESEWEWQNSDEQVDENIRINEYEFDEERQWSHGTMTRS